MRPLIGLTPDFRPAVKKPNNRGEEASLVIRERYVRAVRELGGLPIILPILPKAADRSRLLTTIDGLLITGSGPDIDPRLYGETQAASFPLMAEERARFEIDLTRAAVRKNIPVLGICGGLQLINVALGGSLVQDIGSDVGRGIPHRQTRPASRVSHRIRILRGSRLFELIGRETVSVNSSHHQAPKRVAPGLRINAMAPDGVIEGLEAPGRNFVMGVQWHPECLYRTNEASRRVIQAFLERSKDQARGR